MGSSTAVPIKEKNLINFMLIVTFLGRDMNANMQFAFLNSAGSLSSVDPHGTC